MSSAPPASRARKPAIGLALGGGSARGWAHIGVIRALEEAGIRPDFIAGTSIGALVGAAYAAGELDKLESWARGMHVRNVLRFFDVSLASGLLKGERLIEFIRRDFADRPIEELPIPFAATATALHTGQEVWLRTGSTLDAVRASISFPGLFAPVMHEGRLLVDGGLVNPVPVSLARALGADIVIAVDLSSDLVGSRLRNSDPGERQSSAIAEWAKTHGLALHSQGENLPSLIDVVVSSLQIMQVRIGRSRMAGEPPDLLVAPRIAGIGLLDYHRADEAIEEGRAAVARVAHQIGSMVVPKA
ncbi:MAG TPA: patatin-like phospholipase RssA [Usitatibacter sp.]|nr:patatin-like phospholipase RssA [Usitatibacter sp.]